MQTQKPKKIVHRRYTQNSTEFSHGNLRKKHHIHLRSVQSQLQRKKFASEYAKLTKQFKNILSRRRQQSGRINLGTQRSSHQIERHIFSEGENKQGVMRNKVEQKFKVKIKERDEGNEAQKNNSVESEAKSRNGGKLQNLYSNRLHHEIMETAQKLIKSRKEKINPAYIQTPKSPPKPINGTHANSFLTHSNKSQQNILHQQIYIHLEKEKEKEQKINVNFKNIEQVLAHFHNLYKIRELLDDYKNNYALMVRNIKKYIMNYNKADINKLENLLKIEKEKEKLRIFLCVQKIAVIGILDSMIREYEIGVAGEGKVVLDAIMGVYMSILSYIMTQEIYKNKRYFKKQTNDESVEAKDQKFYKNEKYKESIEVCLDFLEAQGIEKRKDLESTTEYIFKRIQNLFKFNLTLFHKIKQIFTQITKIQITFHSSRVTLSLMSSALTTPLPTYVNINRFFYYLLCEYARNLNSGENVELLRVHKNLLDFFVTCPSPHLVYAPTHKTTVVLQLQGTLAMIKVNPIFRPLQLPQSNFKKATNAKMSLNPNISNRQISIILRPFAQELIASLSKISEIIIMTTLIPQNIPVSMKYANQGYKQKDREREKEIENLERIFKISSAILFRYNYVRYRGMLVKDISRLGRRMEDIVLVQSMDLKSLKQSKINLVHEQAKHKEDKEIPIIQNLLNAHILSTHLHVQNMVPISQWKGNFSDKQLFYLREVLNKIISQKAGDTDVRQILKKYKLNLPFNKEDNEKQTSTIQLRNQNDGKASVESESVQVRQQQNGNSKKGDSLQLMFNDESHIHLKTQSQTPHIVN